MNDATVKLIRKLKDNTGQYLWQPALTAGTPDTILNRPVYTSSFAPLAEGGALAIASATFPTTGSPTVRAGLSKD